MCTFVDAQQAVLVVVVENLLLVNGPHHVDDVVSETLKQNTQDTVIETKLLLKHKVVITQRTLETKGVVPQSDPISTIIISRYYNDLNALLRLTACSLKIP